MQWIDEHLPDLNQAILRGDAAPDTLAGHAREELLPRLPSVGRLTPAEARQATVRLGLLGASLARHYQEWTPGGKQTPERAFDGLNAGGEETPFRDYFAALAERTGTGHCARDSFASLVRWNVGTLEVRRDDEILAVLPGVFDDGRIRTYTGTPGEERFFLLVKQGEAVELAINEVLEPLAEPGTSLVSADALSRVRKGTGLLETLRRLFLDFAALSPEEGMPAEHFLDVFRQFAVHWTRSDIPPSGALDPEALKRDFLLGVNLPGYEAGVRRLFPALLDDEREALDGLMGQPTLPQRLLAEVSLEDHPTHPALADWYGLLDAHARAAGAHLMLSKKFLFKPQRRREEEGLGDRPLVSNRAGTTGMNETFLERLTRARREHPLASLRTALKGQNSENSAGPGVRSHQTVTVVRVG